MLHLAHAALWLIALLCPLAAQSYASLTELRNGTRPYSAVLEFEAGVIGSLASEVDPARGLDDEIGLDGHVYYRGAGFGGPGHSLEGYFGRDGALVSLADGELIGDGTTSKLELRARPWMFLRDGYYDGGDWVSTGAFDGSEYEVYAGFGRVANGELYVELGPYYRRSDFQSSALTVPGSYSVPADYSAYGTRMYLEQSTVQMDRRLGTPIDGFVLALCGEREWNSSSGTFGLTGSERELPSGVWRARGRLEWYVPSSDELVWEIFGSGGWQDGSDHLFNIDTQRPLGNIWGDAQLRLRMQFGSSFSLTPFVHGQYSQISSSAAAADGETWFFGGGLETYWHISDSIAMHAFYSYLDNENRPSVRTNRDVSGEQLFYLGFVTRFGAQRN